MVEKKLTKKKICERKHEPNTESKNPTDYEYT